MLSLGIMVYLIGRTTPRIKNIEVSLSDNFHIRFNKIIAKIPFEKMDIFVSANLEKFLRKVKLFLMKWDNLLAKRLEKLKHANESSLLKKEERPHIFVSPENSSAKFDDIKKDNKEI